MEGFAAPLRHDGGTRRTYRPPSRIPPILQEILQRVLERFLQSDTRLPAERLDLACVHDGEVERQVLELALFVCESDVHFLCGIEACDEPCKVTDTDEVSYIRDVVERARVAARHDEEHCADGIGDVRVRAHGAAVRLQDDVFAAHDVAQELRERPPIVERDAGAERMAEAHAVVVDAVLRGVAREHRLAEALRLGIAGAGAIRDYRTHIGFRDLRVTFPVAVDFDRRNIEDMAMRLLARQFQNIACAGNVPPERVDGRVREIARARKAGGMKDEIDRREIVKRFRDVLHDGADVWQTERLAEDALELFGAPRHGNHAQVEIPLDVGVRERFDEVHAKASRRARDEHRLAAERCPVDGAFEDDVDVALFYHRARASQSKYKFVFFQLNHGLEIIEIFRRRDLDVAILLLHEMPLLACARIDHGSIEERHSVLCLGVRSHFVSRADVAEAERLRCGQRICRRSLFHIRHRRLAFFRDDNGLDDGLDGHSATVLLRDADVFADRALRNERPHAVVDDNDVIRARADALSRVKAVQQALLPIAPADDNALHFSDMIEREQAAQMVEVALAADDDDAVDVLTLLEFFQRIDNDGFAEKLQELFWQPR